MNGILNIYKEPGWTSFDVVAKLRRILKEKKIGHTGTLDPAAEGVLPVCVGKATKLCELLTGGTKTYEAVLLLGQTTDTLDCEGQVLQACPVVCTEEEVRDCVASFLGEQEQIPPMYSALKVDGKRLYELAREGQTVERKARRVTFYALDILKMDLPRVTIRVQCSKGTYIRSLCDDIGKKLGCGGCMEKLIRTQSGGFSVRDARRIPEVEEMMQKGQISEALIPMDAVFADCPAATVLPEAEKALYNGNAVPVRSCRIRWPEKTAAFPGSYSDCSGETAEEENVCPERLADAQQVRLYDSSRNFIGIYTWQADRRCFKPRKILWEGK